MIEHDNRRPTGIGRRSILKGAALTAASAAAISVTGAASATAAPPATLSAPTGKKLPAEVARIVDAWAVAPSNHPTFGDWRFAGYRRGGKDPAATVQKVVAGVSVGIRPNQPQDVSPEIQAALNDLGFKGGGILSLAAGRYVLDNPLFIHDSNVVLRGAGKGRTILYFSRPLKDSIGTAVEGTDQSAWSWTGGQIFFLSRERLAASKAAGWVGREGWLPGEPLTAVQPATRGTDILFVDDSSRLTAGQMVLLDVDNPVDRSLLREMSGDIAGAAQYDWTTRATPIANPVTNDNATWRWPVTVTEILTPRTVRIEQPMRISITRATPARLLPLGPTVHDSGVEDLTIENALLVQTAHNKNPGSNGVCFQAVVDCWAKNIHVLNADLAFGMTVAKSCTLTGISAGGRSLHHFVACRVQSHDNLVQDFLLEDFTVPAVPGSFLHGINVEGLASGNVYRRGIMKTGTFDSHRMLPFETLRTDITITNKDAVPGGGLTAGPFFGARTIHWAITVTNNQNLCMEITDIAPRSATVGIVGLTQPGSRLPLAGNNFPGDLESERIAFGLDLGRAKDLLEIQRAVAPVK